MHRLSRTTLPLSCAACIFLALLTGCGGVSSTAPPPCEACSVGTQFTNVYVVFPPASGVNNTHFMSTVMNQAAINGVTVAVSWIDVEQARLAE